MNRNVALLMLLALCACGAPPEGVTDAECLRPAPQQFRTEAVETVFVTGEQAELAFEWSTHRDCSWRVRARAEGPGGARLEPAVELEPPADTASWRIQGVARFTPTAAGTWRVVLSVEGAQGEVGSELLVAEDRSAAAVQELPRWCQALHRTAQGTLLCDGEVYRGTERVQTLSPESLLATSGDVVWEVEGAWVRRYEDTGTGGLTPAPALSLDTGRTQPLTLHVTEQELLVVYRGGHIARYVHTEGVGLSAAGEATYPYFTYMDSSFQLRRFEDRAVLVASYGTMSAACYYRAAGTGLTLLAWAGPSGQQWNKCQSLAGIAIGMGEAGLWTREAPYSTVPEGLRLYALRGSTLEPSTHWALPALVSVTASQPLSVTTDARVHQSWESWFVPALGPHGVVLERYEPTDGFELRAIHGNLVYEISRGTPARTRIFTR
ncbi:MAG TPA: hypothetical protein VE153_33890 [Myxococcus sp.]|nr:hypothetical protein [Myxococcus sp.]